MKIRFPVLMVVVLSLLGSTLGFQDSSKKDPLFLHGGKQWVDSVFNTLTPRERIAQLLHIAAYSNRTKGYEDSLAALVDKHQIGGLIFFQGGPMRQAKLTNRYQSLSKVPLLISMDAEWGVGMRLDSTINFPYQMTLGALEDDSLIYQMGGEIARQFHRLGMHLNFAPVADVNNNPRNPVINYRSFGEDPDLVTRKALAYMRGMQDQGLLTSAKHFPGHGDTETDSHYDLPQLPHAKDRLKVVELAPFQAMLDAGASGVMVAHMNIPALDNTENLPSTLSKPIVTDLLQDEMGFKGLIMTDALNMKGVTKYYDPGDVDLNAILAGNDMLLFSLDVEKALDAIEGAIKKRKLSQKEIDRRCRKVLAAKYWVGLNKYQPIALKNLIKDLNTTQGELLHRQLVEASLTTLINDGVLPIKDLHKKKIASVSVGRTDQTIFQSTLSKYTQVDHYQLPKDANKGQTEGISKVLDDYDMVILAMHQVSRRPGNYIGYNEQVYQWLEEVCGNGKAVVVSLRNPYTLNRTATLNEARALITTYQDQLESQQLAAQVLFGAVGTSGTLPVTVNEDFKFGMGDKLAGDLRLKYTIPEEVGLSRHYLQRRIDSVVQLGLDSLAYPGAQVLVAKEGKVVYRQVYGHHTYDHQRAVLPDDIYDLASITKITGPLPALMKLHGTGKIDLDQPFSTYWPDWQDTEKDQMTVREVLAHYAQLQAWIAYWRDTKRKNGSFKKKYFRADSSKKYPIKVADNLFLRADYRDKQIYKAIKKSPLQDEKAYVYSGLSFYLYPEIIERFTGQQYEEYLKETFYKPLGAHTLTYNPLRYFPKERIVPTENDDFFRMQQLQGTVHDEGAAMMQGVSGNAGLFSTIDDLAKLMQMYMQEGSYGGQQFITPSSLQEFTGCQYCGEGNRRGLGFDKPVLENKHEGSTAWDASASSYGHSGYTGTFTWVDPEHELLFIFFSNRVYPTRENRKLYQLSIRPGIHQVLYDAMRHGPMAN